MEFRGMLAIPLQQPFAQAASSERQLQLLAFAMAFILFASLFGCAQGQQPPGAAPLVELENQTKLGDLIASSKTAAL